MTLRHHAFVVALCAWLALVATGCFEEPLPMQNKDAGDEDAGAEDAGEAPSTCEDAPDGWACGDARICVDERCVQSRCGDGVRAGDEACDDGNQRVDDDCTPSCRLIPAVCGDGRVGYGEDCDDGNRIDDDSCTNLCRAHAQVDAGAGPSITAGCPHLGGPLRVTAYVGEDERLVGRAFTLEADVTPLPSYVRWFHQDGFGGVYGERDEPLRVTFVCTTQAAEQDAVIYLSGTYPYCTPIAVSVTVTCGPPFVPAMGGSGGAGGNDGGAGASGNDGGSGAGGAAGSDDSYTFEQLNEACRQCAAENYTLDAAGEDVYGKCFGTLETPEFRQACIDAFVCSTLADDGAPGRGDDCSQNAINGAITCYCGQPYNEANCTNDALGPQGACQEAWEVAAGCEDILDVSERANCVLDNFQAFSTPAGIASYAVVLQQGACELPCLNSAHP